MAGLENPGPSRDEVQTKLDSIEGTKEEKILGLREWLDANYSEYIQGKSITSIVISDIDQYFSE